MFNAVRRIDIKLYNHGDGLLDTHPVILKAGDDEEHRIRKAVIAAAEDWALAVGDTIKIEEA